MTEDPNHMQIIEWVVGIMAAIGLAILASVSKMVKGKRSKAECELLHTAINAGFYDIKQRLEKGDGKMDGMKETLVEISTTLKVRSQDETDRYDRHTDGWKDK